MEEVKYKPVALYMLDDAAPFDDYSGYSNTATFSGTQTYGPPLTAPTVKSTFFDNTHTGTFACPVFQTQSAPFTITTTIYPVYGTPGDQAVLSHTGKTDGIRLNGDTISFSTKYTTAGSATTSATLPNTQKVDIVAVHTDKQNSLYFNGVLADQIDITDAQRADTLDISATTLAAGTTAASQGFLMNNVAMFNYALTGEQISAIHKSNNAIADETVPVAFGGQVVEIAMDNRHPYLERIFDDNDQWNAGAHLGTIADDGRLHAQLRTDGLTIESQWSATVPFSSPNALPTFANAYLWWEGSGVAIEISVDDGTSWESVTRGVLLTSIPNGFDPTDKAMLIRAIFTGGLEIAYLDYLTLRVFVGASAQAHPDNRIIDYTGNVVTFNPQPPHLMRQDTGVKIGSSSSVTIEGTASESIKTLGFWVKGGTSPTVTGITPTTTYVNGVAGAAMIANAWNLVHITSTTAATGNITFGANQQVGMVAYYDRVLSATEVSMILESYTGLPTTRINGSGPITVAEPAAPANIYDHPWTNMPAPF